MSKVLRILLVLVWAFAAWALWMGEVRWVKGWAGLPWLAGFNWSALPICALIALSVALLLPKPPRKPNRTLFVSVGGLLMFTAFLVSRWVAFRMFSGGSGLLAEAGKGPLLLLLLTSLLLSVSLAYLADRWLASLHFWTVFLVFSALGLALPLSIITIRILPALNGSTDSIHAFKMGYPVFWLALLLPLALWLGCKPEREKWGSKR
jgi:hypothetical protein